MKIQIDFFMTINIIKFYGDSPDSTVGGIYELNFLDSGIQIIRYKCKSPDICIFYNYRKAAEIIEEYYDNQRKEGV